MDLPSSRAFLASGVAWMKANEFARAIGCFDAAIHYAPDDPYAHWNKGGALLSLGEYREGFVEHSFGWKLFNWRGFGPVKEDIDRLSVLPIWQGETGGKLLVYHELGFGDAIMCLRYLPEIMRRVEMTLVIDPCLMRLAQQCGADYVADRVPQYLGCFDYRLPLFGVMATLQATVETIPNAPYIPCKFACGGNRIGIAWSGRTQTMFTADQFLSLLAASERRTSLHALQPGPAPDYVEPLAERCDFADVARRIALMDHIVTVDTAAAHLAGAMGHPSVHLVLPFVSDWRWWRTEAWYPTIKTYRQPQPGNDWHAPFVQINAALANQKETTDA